MDLEKVGEILTITGGAIIVIIILFLSFSTSLLIGFSSLAFSLLIIGLFMMWAGGTKMTYEKAVDIAIAYCVKNENELAQAIQKIIQQNDDYRMLSNIEMEWFEKEMED